MKASSLIAIIRAFSPTGSVSESSETVAVRGHIAQATGCLARHDSGDDPPDDTDTDVIPVDIPPKHYDGW